MQVIRYLNGQRLTGALPPLVVENGQVAGLLQKAQGENAVQVGEQQEGIR